MKTYLTSIVVTLGLVSAQAGEVVQYRAWNGSGFEDRTAECTPITADMTELTEGWYCTAGEVSKDGSLIVRGDVKIVLVDGTRLSVSGSSQSAGIHVSQPDSLTIYGQRDNSGTLSAYGGSCAAIGSIDGKGSGRITIDGGTVAATNGSYAAAIGCGYTYKSLVQGLPITINGGVVTATAASGYAAGIGATEYSTVDVTINGGVVTAKGGTGIGGGSYDGQSGTVTITGGDVTAEGTCWMGGAGIGGLSKSNGGSVVISGGRVKAKGYCVGVGDVSSVTISGGTVEAIGTSPVDFVADIGALTMTGGALVGKPRFLEQPTNGGEPLFRVECRLPSDYDAVRPLSIEGFGDYGVKDIYTTGGSVCFYLPNGTWPDMTIDGMSYSISVDNADQIVLGEREPVAYMDWDEAKGMLVPGTVTRYLSVTDETDELEDGCFYVVSGEVTRTNSVKVTGAVRLFLTDSARYSIQGDLNCAGLVVEDGSAISIFAQAEGLGSLTACGGMYGAGIGANLADRSASAGRAGIVRIFGGRITAKGGMAAAGIGGGRDGAANSGGTVTIAGGTVVAQGGDGSKTYIMSEGCGIGCGGRFDGGGMPRYSAGMLTILGGSVLTSGAATDQPALIPSNGTERVSCLTIELPADFEPTGRALTIGGLDGYGTQGVFAADGKLAFWLPDGEVTPVVEGVALDTVTVSSENQILSASDQPCVVYRDSDGTPRTRHCTPLSSDLTALEDGRWYVVTGEVSMAYGPTVGLAGRVILADDARLTVTNEWRIEEGKALTIYGSERGTGELTVGGGIVGGYMTSYGAMRAGGSLTVNGGQISTVGTGGSAAVGGFAVGCPGMTVTVNGGYLLAVSSGSGAAIGGGGSSGGSSRGGSGGTVTINGGTVVAQVEDANIWDSPGAYIGGGYGTYDVGSLTINGGAVYANNLGNAPNATPKRAGQTLYRMKMYLDDSPASGPVDIRGIDGYCLRDIYPVDGVVCLYLPSGEYSFTVDGVPYGATVAGKNAIALRTDRPVAYVDSDGRACETPCRFLTSEMAVLEDGCWYAVTGTIERATMSLEGSAQLILTDGARLCVTGSHNQAGFAIGTRQTLTVYGQTTGTGLLLAQGGDYAAGIGGKEYQRCGTLSVCSGTVKATGGYMSEGGIIGEVRIAGGCVSAYGGDVRSDGVKGTSVSVSGGRLLAVGCDLNTSYGISVSKELAVSGGTVIARGDFAGSDIGSLRPISGGQVVVRRSLNQPRDGNGNSAYEVILQVPDGTPEDRPVEISGLGGYGVKDIYPVSGAVRLWLPNGTYENVKVAGVSHSFVVNGSRVVETVDREPLSYVEWDAGQYDFVTRTVTRYFDVTPDTGVLVDGQCYRVSGRVVHNVGIEVQGSATLVLCDESSLVVTGRAHEAGIDVSKDMALTICGQERGTGSLLAVGGDESGIGGGRSQGCGTISIHGGFVTAEGNPDVGGDKDDSPSGVLNVYGGAIDLWPATASITYYGGIFHMAVNTKWIAAGSVWEQNVDPATKDYYSQRVVMNCYIHVTFKKSGHCTNVLLFEGAGQPITVFGQGQSSVTCEIRKKKDEMATVSLCATCPTTSGTSFLIPIFMCRKNNGAWQAVPARRDYDVSEGDVLEFSAVKAHEADSQVSEADVLRGLKEYMPSAAAKFDALATAGDVAMRELAEWIARNRTGASDLNESDYVAASVWLDTTYPMASAPILEMTDITFDTGSSISFRILRNGWNFDHPSEITRSHLPDMIQLTSDLSDWTGPAKLSATISTWDKWPPGVTGGNVEGMWTVYTAKPNGNPSMAFLRLSLPCDVK